MRPLPCSEIWGTLHPGRSPEPPTRNSRRHRPYIQNPAFSLKAMSSARTSAAPCPTLSISFLPILLSGLRFEGPGLRVKSRAAHGQGRLTVIGEGEARRHQVEAVALCGAFDFSPDCVLRGFPRRCLDLSEDPTKCQMPSAQTGHFIPLAQTLLIQAVPDCC